MQGCVHFERQVVIQYDTLEPLVVAEGIESGNEADLVRTNDGKTL